MTKYAIDISGLTKTYANGTQALKEINLRVAEGDFFALLGANGAGKTTVIGILTGLVIKTSGRVKVFEHDLDTQAESARDMMGVVPQEMNFNMFEKVRDIVLNQAGYYGIRRDVALAESERLLKQLELWEKKDQPSRTLSGGMKRRLMIARALINKPKLLILDEPTAGVDVELRHSMWDFLRGLNKEGTTIVLTTHYLEEVEQMCRNAAVIKNGEIIANDRVATLVRTIERETFIVTVEHDFALDSLGEYRPARIDEHTFEVDLNKKEKLNDFIAKLSRLGITVSDIRPKGNRFEKLFLNLLKH